MGAVGVGAIDLVGRVARVAEQVAAETADDVDRRARFPSEAIEALRADHLLSVLVPRRFGGAGAPLSEVTDAVTSLSRQCASTGMIYAMHHLSVACLARHGRSEMLEDYQRDLARDEMLIASATTEVGVGGDMRTSVCAVERERGRYRLEKQAPVISYGADAQAVLATARRSPDSPPNDQVLVLCRPPGLVLDPVGDWDTMGFRGTCSLGFRLSAEGDEALILSDPFGDVATRTMLPVSHVLWSSVWLGLAGAAVDRARRYVQGEARKNPGAHQPASLRLAELAAVYQQMGELVRGVTRRYEEIEDDPEALSGIGFTVALNSLKVSASTLVVDIVGRALSVCGMAGYRERSPFSMARIIRDAYGAALMVNNDRILANNAQMLLVHKED